MSRRVHACISCPGRTRHRGPCPEVGVTRSAAAQPRTRRCRGCGVLLVASQTCEPCDTATVHVITDMGPTEGPGVRRAAQLLGPHVNGMRIFYYDPAPT